MAQYTPNFNLYEPDSTDDFADFRTEFNNNMDIIDQNLGGGGGSGGHTIIDQSGNAMPSRTGLQFIGASVTDNSVNDKTVVTVTGGGGGHNYSTSEQVVGTWTNGKPCYEITLEGSGSYVSNIEHIISIPLNADNVRIMSGFVDIGTDWLPISLTLGLGTGSTNGIYCYPNKSNGLHLFSSAWTFTSYSIVIQYTKTTDT